MKKVSRRSPLPPVVFFGCFGVLNLKCIKQNEDFLHGVSRDAKTAIFFLMARSLNRVSANTVSC